MPINEALFRITLIDKFVIRGSCYFEPYFWRLAKLQRLLNWHRRNTGPQGIRSAPLNDRSRYY
jgi:hypothetical protein